MLYIRACWRISSIIQAQNDVGRVHVRRPDPTARVDEQLPLAAVYVLAAVGAEVLVDARG